MTKPSEPTTTQFEHAYEDDPVRSETMVDVIKEALLSKKAVDITVLDVSGLTTLADFFVVCSGNSDVQIKALADAVEDDVREKIGDRVWKKEGVHARSWIILDFVNVVVHVMSKEKRDFYGIERMWNDAVITYVTDQDP
ncbi:MAG: ribosome silencing factor [Bacteroidota bacterium]